MSSVGLSRKGCPCCAFDLFLPEALSCYPTDEGKEGKLAHPVETLNEDVPCSPQQVLDVLLATQTDSDASYILLDSHGHAQLDRERDGTYIVSEKQGSSPKIQLKSIVCAVEPDDWVATLELASKSDRVLPALGIHPWYLGDGLPERWLEDLEALLVEHPSALVGEIGLCKMARWTRQHPDGKAAALAIQRDVFQKQFQLAAKLRRPVSVHCVNQHGVLKSVLEEIIKQAKEDGVKTTEALPPRIAMHSFTGTAHQAKELISLEKSFNSKADLLIFYFGFSHTVNYVMNTSEKSRRKGREAVKSIPSDRLLVESDVHSQDDLVGGTAGAIGYISWARSESLETVTKTTAQNGLKFLMSVDQCRIN